MLRFAGAFATAGVQCGSVVWTVQCAADDAGQDTDSDSEGGHSVGQYGREQGSAQEVGLHDHLPRSGEFLSTASVTGLGRLQPFLADLGKGASLAHPQGMLLDDR